MRVIIDNNALEGIKAFYRAAMATHITLDEYTVVNKINRLFDAIEDLGNSPNKYPKARHIKKWIEQGCRDFVFEDLHTAYKIVQLDTGERIVYVIDVCHSLLYHD